MVDHTNMRIWVEALRSGQYRQTHSVLSRISPEVDPFDPHGHYGPDARLYCALGVLCDVSGVGEWVAWHGREGHLFGYMTYGQTPDLPSLYSPSRLVRAWLGYPPGERIRVPWAGGMSDVSVLNDSAQLPFSQIADILEEEYLTPWGK